MIKHKVVGLAIGATLLPILAMTILTAIQKNRVDVSVGNELDILGRENITQIAKDIYSLCETANDLVQQKVDADLKVAKQILSSNGKVELTGVQTTWQATNQFTKATTSVNLPKLSIGKQWLEQNRDFAVTSPVVDEIKRLTGGTCTIFQRMNEQGDMLRVATNVENLDRTRAIGSYIPSTNQDGTPNPVVSTVLRGETYHGRAYVVNAWYVTAYEPIRDDQNRVIGMLYVGVKQEAVATLRQAILNTKVGKSGYVYVLGGEGDQKGHYIISKSGERDGEDIWEAKDASGNLFIQSIVSKALPLRKGEVSFERYPWKNQGESKTRTKIAAITYFEPWDWVIGAGSYEDDFYEARNKVGSALGGLVKTILVGGFFLLGIGMVLSFFVGGKLSKPLEKMTQVADRLSIGDINQTVDYHSHDETGKLADSFRKMIQALKTKVEAAEELGRGNLDVQVNAVSADDVLGQAMVIMKDNLRKSLDETNKALKDAQEKVEFLNKIPTPVLVVDSNFVIRYINPAGATTVKMTQQECIGKKCSNLFNTSHCNTSECRLAQAMQRDGVFTGDTIAKLPGGDLPIRYTAAPIKDEKGKVIGALEQVVEISEENMAVREVQDLAQFAINGKLDARGKPEKYNIVGFKNVIQGINDTLNAVVAPVNEAADILQRFASKDFTARVKGDYKGDHARIKESINRMAENLSAVLKETQSAAEKVSSSSEEMSATIDQIAKGTEALASSAEEVSSSVEEMTRNIQNVAKNVENQSSAVNQTSSSVEEMAASIKQVAENSKKANEVSQLARENASEGKGSVDETVKGMKGISESAERISEIIGVITDIAEQTNLLALNAAIEAARAGEQGRGFAVVADEVRTLAGRSAEAAKDITGLIKESTHRAGEGVKLSAQVAEMINRVVGSINQAANLTSETGTATEEQAKGASEIARAMEGLNKITAEISTAMEEQSTGAGEVSKAVADINQVAQENAAGAKQSREAVKDLAQQAQHLQEMVAEFKLT